MRSPLLLGVCLAVAGCHAKAAPSPEQPVSLSFRPTHDGAKQWLATPFAVEITCERDARVLEAMEATYIGEINVSKGKLTSASAASIAAEWGATHFRVSTSVEGRVDVMLYRLEKERWSHLPENLQPPTTNHEALTSL